MYNFQSSEILTDISNICKYICIFLGTYKCQYTPSNSLKKDIYF